MKTNKQPVISKGIPAKIKNNDSFRDSDKSKINLDEFNLNLIDLKKDEFLFHQGDSVKSIYLLIDGEINLISEQSIDKTNSIISKNNFFGQEEYFFQTKRNSTAIALTDSIVVELQKNDIELLLEKGNTILHSIFRLNSVNTISFDDIKNSAQERKMGSIFPMEVTTGNNKKSSSNSSEDKIIIQNVNSSGIDGNNLLRVEAVINKIIKNINESSSQLEKERNKIQDVILDYEKNVKKLLSEIKILKENENKYANSDKEKNEILGQQSYRIIELENESVKLKEQELKYFEELESLSFRQLKIKLVYKIWNLI